MIFYNKTRYRLSAVYYSVKKKIQRNEMLTYA